MTSERIKELESFIKTENEHFNNFAFQMLCEALQQCEFENPVLPLQLFSDSIQIVTKHHENPLQAIGVFSEQVSGHNLNHRQKYFIYNRVHWYLVQSEFDFDHAKVKELFKVETDKLGKEIKAAKPFVKGVREILNDLVHKELETFPEDLRKLAPIQRINILCKLIPFTLSKIETEG